MLDRGETIHIPKYEFARQMRSDILSQPLRLGKDELAIFEGIHALNDVIIGKNPQAFKLYIAARSNVVDEDGSVVFYHHWLRLCRRIVRDYKFRGSDAEFTLKMWPNVRRGEKLYISPYKENADLKFDSSLATEVCVMKPYVVPLLQELPRGHSPDADARPAGEAGAATGQAGSAAGEKVSDYRDLHRLEREIQSLRQEVKLQLQAVGGMLYATHRGKPSDSDELLAKLQVIDGLEERAQALSAQAEALRRKGK